MLSDPFTHSVSHIVDAVLTPDLWPEVLNSLVEAHGAFGAAYILWRRGTGEVEWVSISGPALEFRADYVSHYAALDPFHPVLDAGPSGSWLLLTKSLPKAMLNSNEWYNDFARNSGIGDIAGTRLFANASNLATFGLHFGSYQAKPVSMNSARLQQLFKHLSNAARM